MNTYIKGHILELINKIQQNVSDVDYHAQDAADSCPNLLLSVLKTLFLDFQSPEFSISIT
jgi:hypothetical protein